MAPRGGDVTKTLSIWYITITITIILLPNLQRVRKKNISKKARKRRRSMIYH